VRSLSEAMKNSLRWQWSVTKPPGPPIRLLAPGCYENRRTHEALLRRKLIYMRGKYIHLTKAGKELAASL
jgi:hypothetical protein